MENLKSAFKWTYNHPDDARPILRLANGFNPSVKYLIDRDSNILEANYQDNSLKKLTSLYPECSDDNLIVGFETITQEERLLSVYQNGDIFSIEPLSGEVPVVNLEGQIEGGCRGVFLSPDECYILFLTNKNTFVIMTYSLEPICENAIDLVTFGTQEFITVGWGSKETQFHGTAGKVAAKEKSISKFQSHPNDSNPLNDEHSVTAAWRPDSSLFAISSWDANPNESGDERRKIRIFDKEGKLQATSEGIHCLDSQLSWNSSGDLLVSSQVFPAQNKQDIIFFEKNGLRHGEFTLKYSPDEFQVTSVRWSSESSYLFILGWNVLPSESIPRSQHLLIYRRQNYHWYLKQELHFTPSNELQDFAVEFSGFLKLHSVHKDGAYRVQGWTQSFEQHLSSVATVDGCHLLLTPYDKACVPPPMSLYRIAFPASINFVTCHNSQTTPHKFLALLSDSCVHECSFDPLAKSWSSRSLGSLPHAQTISHISAVSNGIICIRNTEMDSDVVDFYDSGTISEQTQPASSISIPGKSIMCAQLNDLVALVLDTADALVYDAQTQSINPLDGSYETDLIAANLVTNSQLATLDNQFRLKVGNRDVGIRGCTSFLVHDKFLLVETFENKLYSLPLDNLDRPNEITSTAKNLIVKEQWRSVERSILVTSDPATGKVILQMPRGNIEVIYPRQLLVPLAGQFIERLDYLKAFSLMRKHRINLNYLIDYNPRLFLEQLDSQIIPQLTSVELNLILGELSDEITCKSLAVHSSSKRDFFCNVIREGILRQDSWQTRYLEALLMTHIKQTNQDVAAALQIIKNLPQDQRNSPLKFLSHILDTETLYKAAMGSYDLDMVLMVAKITQKDPKEYLPFINELETIKDGHYRNYKIDMHLNHYDKALTNLSKSTSLPSTVIFEKCTNLILEYRLYRTAISLWPPGSDEAKTIWTHYGEYLRGKRHYNEAAIAFSRAAKYSQAITCSQLVNDWRASIRYARLADLSSEELCNLADSLATNQIIGTNYLEAAHIYELYCGSEKALKTLIEGGEWDHAGLFLEQHSHLRHLFVTTLRSKLDTFLETISGHRSTLSDLLQSVKNGRHNRENMADSANLNNMEPSMDDEDNMSVVNSIASIGGRSKTSSQLTGSIATRKTAKSEKVAKRKNLKRYILKKGSPTEDLAAIYQIKTTLLPSLEDIQREAKQLLRALYEHTHVENTQSTDRAHYDQVETSFENLMRELMEGMDLIWPTEIRTISTPSNEGLIPDDELRCRPSFKKLDWKLSI